MAIFSLRLEFPVYKIRVVWCGVVMWRKRKSKMSNFCCSTSAISNGFYGVFLCLPMDWWMVAGWLVGRSICLTVFSCSFCLLSGHHICLMAYCAYIYIYCYCYCPHHKQNRRIRIFALFSVHRYHFVVFLFHFILYSGNTFNLLVSKSTPFISVYLWLLNKELTSVSHQRISFYKYIYIHVMKAMKQTQTCTLPWAFHRFESFPFPFGIGRVFY